MTDKMIKDQVISIGDMDWKPESLFDNSSLTDEYAEN